ncbi:GMC family oxidoreductase [Sphingopyxis microcysteis]|uniref:GMC family oxidoreductase n=1 Tax=Sphingopyxis microcysteis TaxID=2484145 RepID=UPI0014458C07|nr:GMC family oxidoreductase N-terminal domain-containing protein [Sphingopyxis microcysteis]
MTFTVEALPSGDEYDYIIVGAGSAGCVIASRLTEDPKVSVLLIESGGSERNWKFRIPGGQSFVKDWGRYAWLYRTESDPSRNDRTETWRRGRILGGSSSINGVIYAIGLPRDFDLWAEMGASGWSWRDVEPFFRRAERCPGLQGRGQSGPVHVEILRSPHRSTEDLIASANAVGIQAVKDINLANSDAIGIAQTNQLSGLRQDSATAYLRPAWRRRNLRILTHARVARVIFDQGQASGLQLSVHDKHFAVKARREIVLSAGAIGSPHLLMLSGIGPAQQLQAHGIAVVADSLSVGSNLHDHPELYIEYEVKDRTYSSAMQWHQLALSGLQFALARRGQATSCASHILAYARSRPEEQAPDLLLFSGPWGYLEDNFTFQSRVNTYSLSPSLCHPRSRGRIALRSPDPREAPVIDPNLLGDHDDVIRLMRGVRLVDRIAQTRPFSDRVMRRLSPDFDLSDDSSLEAYIRENASICYHACGTCRMGDDPSSVVDSRLRVRGVGHLTVADASVIPLVTSGNLHAPTVMIGERAAELLREPGRFTPIR